MKDDRQEFEAKKRQDATRMSQDPAVRDAANTLYAKAYEYDYTYMWSWMGVPIIQSPDDICAMQEIIWETKPQVIVETGVARGGSILFSAAMLQLLGEGKVIGVDIEIRPHNRESIETHPLSHRVELIEADAVADATLEQVRQSIGDAERVMVVLDSNHTHDHVLAELRAYAPLVSPGQSLIVADTAVELDITPTERDRPWGVGDNPMTAMRQYLTETDDFVSEKFINEKLLLTSNPDGYLRRKPIA
ncbi:MAG: CmcI family methyltransferase [Planctomycetota bacterium]